MTSAFTRSRGVRGLSAVAALSAVDCDWETGDVPGCPSITAVGSGASGGSTATVSLPGVGSSNPTYNPVLGPVKNYTPAPMPGAAQMQANQLIPGVSNTVLALVAVGIVALVVTQ